LQVRFLPEELFVFAGDAILVMHQPSKLSKVGSIPIARSMRA
jgi:hypothetical protein